MGREKHRRDVIICTVLQNCLLVSVKAWTEEQEKGGTKGRRHRACRFFSEDLIVATSYSQLAAS